MLHLYYRIPLCQLQPRIMSQHSLLLICSSRHQQSHSRPLALQEWAMSLVHQGTVARRSCGDRAARALPRAPGVYTALRTCTEPAAAAGHQSRFTARICQHGWAWRTGSRDIVGCATAVKVSSNPAAMKDEWASTCFPNTRRRLFTLGIYYPVPARRTPVLFIYSCYR